MTLGNLWVMGTGKCPEIIGWSMVWAIACINPLATFSISVELSSVYGKVGYFNNWLGQQLPCTGGCDWLHLGLWNVRIFGVFCDSFVHIFAACMADELFSDRRLWCQCLQYMLKLIKSFGAFVCCLYSLDHIMALLLALVSFCVVFSLCIFRCCFVCQYQSSDWLWRPPLKWPRLYLVECCQTHDDSRADRHCRLSRQ